MRVVFAILHMLVGLLALAMIAGLLAWALPSAAAAIWPIAYISMAVLVVTAVVRMVRGKPGST